MSKWIGKPLGIGLPVNQTVTAAQLKGYDFAVVTLGDPDYINESIEPQCQAAKAAGIPVVGVYRPDFKLYVERGQAPWDTWDMNSDPYVCKLPWARYYTDRMISGRYIHAVMLDGRNVVEGKNTDGSVKYILNTWWTAVMNYYAKVVSRRYKLPWYAFMTKSALNLVPDNQVLVDWFMNVAGSNACVSLSKLDGAYPDDAAKPEYIANAIDFWLFKTGEFSSWLFNGTKTALYSALNFTPPVVVPDVPDDPTDPEPEPNDPPTGDYGALLAEAKKTNALLEKLSAHLGVK